MNNSQTQKKLTAGIITVIILAVCLCITSFALIYASVSVENNIFITGNVKINLNDGKPIITENEFIFEPGMTVEKEFFIENQSSSSVYYKIYFMNIKGGLAKVLTVTVKDKDTVLFSGSASEFTKANVTAPDAYLSAGEKKLLTITFHYPEDSGNETQSLSLSFDLAADAVQTKNNPNKQFD